MLQLRSFVFNGFSENTYVLYNGDKDCWIVDPGMYDAAETKAFTTFLKAEGLTPRAIINTHAHIDHIFGVPFLTDEYELPFHLHPAEETVLRSAKGAALLFGLQIGNMPKPNLSLQEGVPLMLGSDMLEVRFTPGHSPGSVSFYYEPGGWVIGGDVLFAGGIGRTDLPGGHYETLIRSINTQLMTLPAETIVYSGHGPATSVGQEQANNPFLQ